MNDHDALLRAICENPREDTPRLAFADWLEENGEPDRAAFIRTDVAMALREEWDAERLSWEEGPPRTFLLHRAGLNPLPDSSRAGLAWRDPRRGAGLSRRGFPWALWVTDLGLFRQRAAELFARHPIECLAFPANLPQLDRLVREPWFPRVTGLEWGGGRYSPQGLRPLLGIPDPVITEVAATAPALAPDGVRAVFESLLFANLTHFRLIGVTPRVARAAVESLARPGRACRLRSLAIRGDGLNRDLLLLACSLPESLRILDVSSSRINSAQVREFAGAKAVSGLRMLTMSANALGNDGGTALFTSPHLAGLKVLVLQYCQVGDDALRALLENSPLADGLNLLDLHGSPASGDMKEAVTARMGDRVRI